MAKGSSCQGWGPLALSKGCLSGLPRPPATSRPHSANLAEHHKLGTLVTVQMLEDSNEPG